MNGQATMSKRNDIPVRIDVEAVRKARVVAAYRNIPLNGYLSSIVLAAAAADLAAEQEKNAEVEQPKRRPGRPKPE